MTYYLRTAFRGLAALVLAATLSVAGGGMAPAVAAERSESVPESVSDATSANQASCHIYSDDLHACDRTWWPGGSPDPGESGTDTASLYWDYNGNGRWLILAACDFNNDGTSIGIQIDPSDGADNYYTRRRPTISCSSEPETRLIHRFRFVAVNREGTPVGTPTEWETPPWGAGPA